jgi:hypothetical protein
MKRKCSSCKKYVDGKCSCATRPGTLWCNVCQYALPSCACAVKLPQTGGAKKAAEIFEATRPRAEQPKKLPWHNTPMWFLKPVAMVGQMGEGKYATYDFLKKPQTANEHLNSLKRHLEELENPTKPDTDSESNINHAAHIAWRALALYHVLTTRPDLDDRYKG